MDAEEGTQAGAEVIAGQAAITNLPPLDPQNLTPITITIEDPTVAPTVPAKLPATAPVEAVAHSGARHSSAPPSEETEETQEAPTNYDGFHANGTAGEGTSRKGNKKPCEVREGITKVSEDTWSVQRSLVDYYAAHVAELDRQAGSETHYDENKKADGLRLLLGRCSVLKQVGLRHGDIVHTVNGIKVHSLVQAISTWFKLRDASKIEMILTRKGERKTFHFVVTK